MAMFIGLGISDHAAPAGTVTPPIVGALAQVAPMPVDSAVFDSGAARGANAEDIPLSGTTDAADGTPIEARIVRADIGTQVHPWATIATASGGAWSGSFPAVPRSPHWLKAQVRVQGSAAVAQTGNSFAVGNVWSVWAQSVANRLLLGVAQPYFADEPLAAEGNLQIWSIPRSGTAPSTQAPVVRLATSAAAAADEVTPRAVVIANAMQAARLGEKFAIIAHTVSGTSPVKMITPVEDFATPGDKGRFWEDEVALHNADTAHGTQVGAVFNHSWDGFDISSFNARRFVPTMTQKNVDGTPLTLGDTVLADNPAQSFVLHHRMTELYDYSYTKIGFIDGKRDRIGPASNVFSYATLAEVPTNWESVAPLWRQVSADDVKFPEFLDYQGPVMGHVSGISDGAGGWQDTSHASIQDEYGIPYYGGIVANLMIRATGLIAFDDPVIINSDWTPTHIDLWNPNYDITTNRTLEGGTSPFVRGFFFDGLEITTEAQLLPNAGGSGRQGIRITPAGGVDGSEILQYGRSGSPGLLTSPDDYIARYVLDLPVMGVGQAGIAALPAVMQTTLDSNLVGLPFFEKDAGVSGSAYPAIFTGGSCAA